MGVMVQIRNVPEEAHRKLKARAAAEGLSLSDYLLRMAQRDLERPTMAELYARVKSREPVELTVNVADLIREERDRR